MMHLQPELFRAFRREKRHQSIELTNLLSALALLNDLPATFLTPQIRPLISS